MKHWILKRKDNQAALELHGQFDWADEFNWQSLAQSEGVRSLSGALIIQQGLKLAGRPITLNGSRARLSLGDLRQLQAWADVPELTMQLDSPDGRQFSVIFRRPALNEMAAIKPYRLAERQEDDAWRVNIQLMTI